MSPFNFVLFDIASEHADLCATVAIEVETVSFSASDLQQVVIKCLLGNVDFLGCIIQGHLDEDLVLVVETSVESTPKSNLL
jgi:hypothetical protein